MIEIKIIDSRVSIPKYATNGSCAFDLVAAIEKEKQIFGNQRIKIGTGIAISMAELNQYAALILPRSSLGSKGLVLANLVGLIDSDYQGEIILSLWNSSFTTINIQPLQRVAQLLIVPIAKPQLNQVNEFSIKTDRGESGFGSTGTHQL